jgi:membrane protease YdiL (CAAX protease family)
MAARRATHPRLTPEAGTAVLIGTAAVVLTVFYYFGRADAIGVYSAARGWTTMTGPALGVGMHAVVAALLLGGVPVLVARWALGYSLADLGLGLGNWRRGLVLLAAGLPLAVVAGWIGSTNPLMRAVYPLATAAPPGGVAPYALMLFLYFGAWEVLFRGVLLFGIRRTVGEWPANATQTAISTTAHFGRAINETGIALPAGVLFGWIDLRIGSIWYLAVVHWVVGVSMEWFIGW